jgi:hypothetical protein
VRLSAQLRFCIPVNMKLKIVLGNNYVLRPILNEKCFLFFWYSDIFLLFFRQCWLVTNHQYLLNFRLNDMTEAHSLRIFKAPDTLEQKPVLLNYYAANPCIVKG